MRKLWLAHAHLRSAAGDCVTLSLQESFYP